MERKSKVVGVSLPPEIHNKVEKYLQESHKSRSEFYREMISLYFAESKSIVSTSEKDLALLLKDYWDQKSSASEKVLPIVLGIIVNNKNEVLIGAREFKDLWVENLTWVFPGGKLKSLDFELELQTIIKKETRLDVVVKDLVCARIHPDSGFKPVQVVALYFHCEVNGDVDMVTSPANGLKELKWVKPLDVFKYFTTSTSDDVTKFLTMIQKSI